MFGYKPFIRRLVQADGSETPGWFWTPVTKWLHHGGWFYVDLLHPVATIKWWLRFITM